MFDVIYNIFKSNITKSYWSIMNKQNNKNKLINKKQIKNKYQWTIK